jgi:serine/threonine-protein kinase
MNDFASSWEDFAVPQSGRYVLEGQVGVGGMADVYRARESSSGRHLALKFSRGDFITADERTRARLGLLREGWTLSKIHHPNVVALFDMAATHRMAMLALELVDGPDLTAWALRGPGWREILSVYIAAGEGLAAVHDAGFVHRDFKPSNVLIGSDGRVRVADFGLSIPEGLGQAVDGFVVGTPRYMAPEHRMGAAASKLSDQYSFCYSMGETLLQAGGREAQVEPAPSALWNLIRIGMNKQPARRFESMHSLVKSLRSITKPSQTDRAWPVRIPVQSVSGNRIDTGTTTQQL